MTTRSSIALIPAVVSRLFILVATLIAAAPSDAIERQAVSVIPIDKIPYLSLVELAETYNLKIDWDPVVNAMTVSRGNNSLTLRNHSRLASYNGSIENLMAPVRLFHGTLYAPASTCLPIVSRLFPGTLAWDNKEWKITSSEIIGSISSVSFEERVQGTLIRIILTEPVQYQDALRDIGGQKFLGITLNNCLCSPDVPEIGRPIGMVKNVRTEKRDGDMVLSLYLSGDMERYDITRNADSKELLISLRAKRTQQATKENEPPTAIIPRNQLKPMTNGDIWVIDTIVIDPGHGGKDPGAIGPKGTREKDIVLDIGRELKKIADDHGEIKAVMTRDKDEFVTLRDRATRARAAHGKVFISIHANSNTNRSVTGLEVYFLSVAKEENAKRVAERENGVIQFEDNPEFYSTLKTLLDNQNLPKELKKIQGDMAYNVFLTESQNMCSILLDSAISLTRQSSRGVKQAGFYVMLGTQASMPSVLFEVGFISNPDEEKLLRRASQRKRIAQGIYDAVITFKKLAEKDLITMSGSNDR